MESAEKDDADGFRLEEGGDKVYTNHTNALNAATQNNQEEDLCCCEYINLKGERSHILGLCCDCDTLDDSVERLIQRKPIPGSNYSDFCNILCDRFRIPWYKGARQINLSFLAPFAIFPLLGFIATIGPTLTIISFIIILVGLRIFSKYNRNNRTGFYFSLSLATLIYTFLVVYYTINISSVLLLLHIFLVSCILIFMQITRRKCQKDDSLTLDDLPFYYFCRKCQFYINGRDHHCIWLDCCIGKTNRCSFISNLIFGILWIILIIYSYYYQEPNDDKSESVGVYSDYSSAISFVSLLYASMILIFLVSILIHQLNMTYKGVSYLDYKYKNSTR